MDHVERLLALFDLVREADWPIRSYSNGQQKKTAICSALVTEAPVMLLDEPFSDGAAVSLLLGWWVYAITANIPADKQVGVHVAGVMAISYASLRRVAAYGSNHWWPISLWGRLRTGRWIIPRYDRILAAPILAVLIQVLGPTCLQSARVGVAAAVAVSVALAASVLLNMGPTLADWQLTGGHRIVPGFAIKREFVQL